MQETSLSKHEAEVAAFYVKGLKEHLSVKERPYITWGYWKNEAQDLAQACEALVEEVIAAADIRPEHAVLDVGCGMGVSTLEIARKTSCRSVVGIDIVPEFMDYARKQVSTSRVTFCRMSATALDFPPGSFDRVIAIDCASHFKPRTSFFPLALHVLKPGGRLVLADTIEGSRPQRGTKNSILANRLLSMWHVPEENRYGLEKYLELLQAAGFQRTHGRNISEHVFPPAFSYILSDAYMDKFSAEMGWLASMMERRAISALNSAYQKGFLDFVIVAAER